MDVSVVVFTRDLRVRDNPALATASSGSAAVIPLFVFDPAIVESGYASPNRVRFLLDALADLRRSLRDLGGDLVIRHGDTVDEAVGLAREYGAEAIHLASDVSRFASRREHRLAEACAAERMAYVPHPGPTVIDPGTVTPTSGDHYKVFTPYWRAWKEAAWRDVAPTPRSLDLPTGLGNDVGAMPDLGDVVGGEPSPDLAEGGESVARSMLNGWTRSTLARYDDIHDDLPGDETSRLSPHLHFGCVSSLEVATRLRDRDGGAAYVRQLCWRDFHHQVTAAFPSIATEEYRSQGDDWRGEGDDLEAWKEGRTGFPIVDAGMRQLHQEGWMHNRARMVTASFLTKDLYVDWRLGAGHFLHWLVDGDIANNSGNWQWTAGTGNDTRPNRVFNPLRQAERFDPDGTYVRRYVPELAGVDGKAVHKPWELGDLERSGLDYPAPIVDHDEAAREFKERRG